MLHQMAQPMHPALDISHARTKREEKSGQPLAKEPHNPGREKRGREKTDDRAARDELRNGERQRSENPEAQGSGSSSFSRNSASLFLMSRISAFLCYAVTVRGMARPMRLVHEALAAEGWE